MNTIEQIKAEIERRINEDYNGPDKHDNEIAQGVCASIIAFLDTLPKEPTTTCSTSEPSDAAVWAAVGAFKPDVWVTSDGRFRLTINAYHISQLCGRCFMGEGPTIYAAAVEVYKQLKEGAK